MRLPGALQMLAAVAVVACGGSLSPAAEDDFYIRHVEFGHKIRSGSQSVSGGLSGLGDIGGFPQDWGVVTTHFDSKPSWADDVTLKYHVLVRNEAGKNAMLTGNVIYVAVQAGLDHESLMFIHPNSLARYGAVRRILVEIWYQGILADSKEWPNESHSSWWNKVPAIAGALRVRYFTPFEHDYEVREEDIKLVLP